MTARVNGDLQVQFTAKGLTSFAGLELLIRYLRRIGLNNRIRHHLGLAGLSTDFGVVSMVRLIIGLLIVGGQRVRHVVFLESDPLLLRFAGVRDLPTPRTVGRWLRQFKVASVQRLAALNAEIVAEVVARMPLRTLTVDVDGTVLSTGLKVERAFRGYNPHHRKVPSYYPITAHVAETGHVLRVKNRSGNIHDGAASLGFLRDLFGQVTQTLGRSYRLNFRMDGAYFHQDVIRLLSSRGAGFAIKVPFWRWLDLQQIIRERRHWKRVSRGVDGFQYMLPIDPWGIRLRVLMYRKRVHHRSPKNYQLDLFDPDDGYYEYSAIATNLNFELRRMWNFMCGRGAHEKVIGELKNGLAFDTVPSARYGANSAWQQLSVIAYNLVTNFQIETGVEARPRSEKRTVRHVLKSIRTLRFELVNRAGQVLRPGGLTVLKLASNQQTEKLFTRMAQALARAA